MPTESSLKKSIANAVFAPLRQGVTILDKDAVRIPYELSTAGFGDFALMVLVRGDHGPRAFEVRVREVQ